MSTQTTLFDLPPVAHARRTDPVTSHLAAGSVAVNQSQMIVLSVLQKIREGTDESILEAIVRFGMGDQITPSGARSRRDELVELSLVRNSGRHGLTKSGRASIIWEVC